MDKFFNEDCGYLLDEVADKLKNNGELSGDEALAYLADRFANQTHGNYHASTLFYRLNGLGDYKLKITKK